MVMVWVHIGNWLLRRACGFQNLVGSSLFIKRAYQDFCLLQNQVLTIRDCGSSALFIVFFSYLKDLTEVFLLFSRQFASFSIGSFPAFPTTHFNLRDYLYYSHDCLLLLYFWRLIHVHPHHYILKCSQCRGLSDQTCWWMYWTFPLKKRNQISGRWCLVNMNTARAGKRSQSQTRGQWPYRPMEESGFCGPTSGRAFTNPRPPQTETNGRAFV